MSLKRQCYKYCKLIKHVKCILTTLRRTSAGGKQKISIMVYVYVGEVGIHSKHEERIKIDNAIALIGNTTNFAEL